MNSLMPPLVNYPPTQKTPGFSPGMNAKGLLLRRDSAPRHSVFARRIIAAKPKRVNIWAKQNIFGYHGSAFAKASAGFLRSFSEGELQPVGLHFLLGCLCFFVGCAQISDSAKKIWGSSTTALERARAEGLKKSYSCTFLECYEAVLSLGRKDKMMVGAQPYNPLFAEQDQPQKEEEAAPKVPVEEGKYFDVFLKDPRQRHIVVMGVNGNIDTTEVGIFFEDAGPSTIRIDISSLSTTAKRRVAQAVFEELDKRFAPAS